MINPLAVIVLQAKAAEVLGDKSQPQTTPQPREDITIQLACWNMLNTALFSLF